MRLVVLSLVVVAAWLAPRPCVARADETSMLRLEHPLSPDISEASFVLVNRTSDVLTFTAWDGNFVMGRLERLEGRTWVEEGGVGYLLDGIDAEVVLLPGDQYTLMSSAGFGSGTYRIVIVVQRRRANGMSVEFEVTSLPFRHP